MPDNLVDEFPDLVVAVNKTGVVLCHCCGRYVGTRAVVLDGRPVLFCSACPDPAELRYRAMLVQVTWSKNEERKRRRGQTGDRFEIPAVRTRRDGRTNRVVVEAI